MEIDYTSLASYQYSLPNELIANHPCALRDHSRLMVVERASGSIYEIVFQEIKDLLKSGDHLIFNDTKVIPARLFGKKNTGAVIEVFLVEEHKDGTWIALTKPAKKVQPGTNILFSNSLSCVVLEDLSDGAKRIKFQFEGDFHSILEKHGAIPLPPYIRRNPTQEDAIRYQTVFAKNRGAIASPTAALHFTPELLNSLRLNGISTSYLTLHIGLGTFRPVVKDDIRQHTMHAERYAISAETAQQLNIKTGGNRRICVGTTTCRALEFASNPEGVIHPGSGSANLFIYPGYKFKYVTSLLTNFHLPGSTLLMLVSAFGGYELIKEAYTKAVKDRFRFYSYGDAMLII